MPCREASDEVSKENRPQVHSVLNIFFKEISTNLAQQSIHNMPAEKSKVSKAKL